jgi:LCP family protein required for cell wall assembly
MPPVRWVRRHPFLAGVTVILGSFLGLFSFFVAQPAARFRDIASEQFTPEAARAALAGAPPSVAPASTTSTTAAGAASPDLEPAIAAAFTPPLTPIELATVGSPLLPDDMFTSVLLIGSDKSGALADVILLVLLPNDGGDPMMVSLPRDLWLPNPCTESFGRINAALNGCGDLATGPELLSLVVEDFTGVAVDHYARVNFAGFSSVIDWMGGVTVCVDAPTRDAKAHLQLDGGCVNAGGETALAWVRSRTTEQLIDGRWQLVAGSDFSRQRRQQDVLIQLAAKLSTYRSPTSLAEALERLSSAVKMDSGWTISQIAALGYRYRDLDLERVARLTLETVDYRTSGGAYVVLPSVSFNDTIAPLHPEAAR